MKRQARVVLLMLLALSACGKPRVEVASGQPAVATRDAAITPRNASDASASNNASAPASMRDPMILLKGGRFRMGTPYTLNLPEEYPPHMVTLPTFRLDVTQVTVAAYRVCVNVGACAPPATQDVEGPSAWTFPDVDQEPMTGITWQEAHDYCAWAGKELPTEEQWEYACAGSAGRVYPWGSDFPDPGDATERVAGNCHSVAHDSRWHPWTWSCPVGQNPAGATPQGIQDLMGKTGEWTASAYCPYDHRDCADPKRTVRGGGGGMEAVSTRCASRGAGDPSVGWRYRGFRCAQRVDETPDAGGAKR